MLANHDVYWSDGPTYSLALSTTEPDAPRGLRADSGDTAVTLNWSAPQSDGGKAITAYHYRYKTDGEYGAWTPIDDRANATSYTVTGLMNDTAHTFQVAAENSAGLGLYSDEVTQTPRACTPPGAPTIGSVVPTGFGKLTLNWSAPTELGTCGAIDGYEVRAKKGVNGTYTTWSDIDNSANLTSYEFTGGEADTTFYFQLRATAGTSNGTESDEGSGTTWAPIEVRLDVPSSVREDAGSVTFAVVAETPAGTGRPDFEFSVDLSTSGDTAKPTTDYGSLSVEVTFKPTDFAEDPATPGRFTARLTVLVPTVAGPAWEVGESWAGRRHLEDAARTVAVTLLTLTPENAAHVREAAARLSAAEALGPIGAWVAAEAERMARRDLSTAFYPRAIEGEPDALAVEIAGELVTWIGREEAFRERRRYRLAFRGEGGRLGLVRFEQMED